MSYCLQCYGLGWFYAFPKRMEEGVTMGPFVFKCQCPIGRTDKRNYPLWRASDEKDYVLDQYRAKAYEEAITGKPSEVVAERVTVKPYSPKTDLNNFFDGLDD